MIKSVRKGIEILAIHLFSFSVLGFNMKVVVILFIKKSIC